MTTKRVPLYHEWTQTGSSSGLFSARPAASTAGAGYVYTATDTGVSYVSTGSDWNQAEIGSTGGAPSGSAGGDLTGTYPNPTLAPGSNGFWKTVGGVLTRATTVAWSELTGIPSTFAPSAHHTSHESGGSDAIKLDDLAAPDNNTDLNVSTSAHGLTPILPNDSTKFLNGVGAYAVPSATGAVASDTIWDAKGDLVAGTGADTASKLTVGSDTQVLTADSTQSTGLKWAAASGGAGIGGSMLVYRYTVAGAAKATIDTGVDTPDAGSNDWTDGDLLEVYLLARTDLAGVFGTVNITLNNDTGGNYDFERFQGNNVTTASVSSLAQTAWAMDVHGDTGTASYATAWCMTFPDFAGTTFFKTATLNIDFPDGTAGNNIAEQVSLGYRSTSAISRLKLAAAGATKLKIGSQLLIYKRKAS